jgi:hypothetical protein
VIFSRSVSCGCPVLLWVAQCCFESSSFPSWSGHSVHFCSCSSNFGLSSWLLFLSFKPQVLTICFLLSISHSNPPLRHVRSLSTSTAYSCFPLFSPNPYTRLAILCRAWHNLPEKSNLCLSMYDQYRPREANLLRLFLPRLAHPLALNPTSVMHQDTLLVSLLRPRYPRRRAMAS